MGTERSNYQISMNATTYQFQGAKYVYDAIKRKIGASLVTERSSGAAGRRNSDVQDVPAAVKKRLPRIIIVLQRDGLGNSANADQSKFTRRIKIYVDPDKMESALATLPNTTVRSGLTTYRIIKAYQIRKICYC
jgi:hypothetical protein